MKDRAIVAAFLWLLGSSYPLIAQPVENLLSEADRLFGQNEYVHAQEKYLHALRIAEEQHDGATMAHASRAVARCHYYLYDRAASLKWFYTYLQTIQQHRLDSLLSSAYYHIGVMYIEAEKIDSAEKYALKAIGLMRDERDYARLSQTYCTLTELYLNTTKDTVQIENTLKEAEKYAELSENKTMMAFAASKRYNYCFFLKKDYPQALQHINKAEGLYLETGNRESILNAFRAKAECLIMLRDTLALPYMTRWFSFKDSVLQAEKAVNVAKFETLYETEKKERENRLLLQQNELNRLQLQARNGAVLSLFIALLLVVVIGLWWLNRSNLKRKQQELLMMQDLQKEKERIARDLHDNVGGQLSYIIYSLDGISNEDINKRTEVTESIGRSVRSVIGSLRETIWAISDANIHVQDLSDKLKVFARDLFKHTEVKVSFTESMTPERELNALLGLNLYRICQEILNNAFKHANASAVRIDMTQRADGLAITISDDGTGFDPQEKNREQYGLQNMRKRASEFGISLNMDTTKGKGTRYVLVV